MESAYSNAPPERDPFSAAPFWDHVAQRIVEGVGAATVEDGRVVAGMRRFQELLLTATAHREVPALDALLPEALDAATRASGSAAPFHANRETFWGYARLFFVSRLRRCKDDPLDVANECVVQLSRYFGRLEARQEPLRNVEAIMTTISRRRLFDTWSKSDPAPIDELEPIPDSRPLPDEVLYQQEISQQLFLVREFFGTCYSRPSCLEIMDRIDGGIAEHVIGQEFDVSRDVVAQRWRRCRKQAANLHKAGLL